MSLNGSDPKLGRPLGRSILRGGPQGLLISRCRMGILSITRLNSRMSQAKGLRSLILPSLPIKTQLKPLGCKVLRRLDWALGSVSTTIMTSRSCNTAISACKSAICWVKVGSSGLSANTTQGRATQMTSDSSTSLASKIWVGSERQMSKVSPAKTGGAMARSPSHKWNTLLNMISPSRLLYRAFAIASEGVERKIPGTIDPWDKERGQ